MFYFSLAGPAQVVDAGPLISANNAFYDNIGIFPVVNVPTGRGRGPQRKLKLKLFSTFGSNFMLDLIQSSEFRDSSCSRVVLRLHAQSPTKLHLAVLRDSQRLQTPVAAV